MQKENSQKSGDNVESAQKSDPLNSTEVMPLLQNKNRKLCNSNLQTTAIGGAEMSKVLNYLIGVLVKRHIHLLYYIIISDYSEILKTYQI